ncbi:MAG: tight adherence protein B [Planctomycetota bacterium]|nr:MAG: tight adherence protein B [Planctomycetota bacterium]
MSVGVISILAFVFVSTLVAGLYFVSRDLGKTSEEERLEVLTGRRRDEPEGETLIKGGDLLKETASSASSLVGQIGRKFTGLGTYLEQGDCKVTAEKFLMVVLGCMGAGAFAGWIIRLPAPMYPVCGLMAGGLPWLWAWWKRRSRCKKFAAQLPDAMSLIARALRSGHSLPSALSVISDEMPTPVSTEFGMAFEEQNLGVPIDKALRSMLKRMPNLDLKFFVTAVAIQKQSGGDLAEILDKISYVIRERFKILGTVAALTAEGRLSGIVLMALPFALFLAVYALNPEYVMLLFTSEEGRKMVGVAVVMQILGAVVIKKIVNIKV